MSISDTQKTDFLWKKLIYGVTQTSISGKAGANETVSSPLPTYAANIWSESVPTPAPGNTTSVVHYYDTDSAIRFTKDPTVTSGSTWFATSTYNDIASRIGDWVPPAIDPGYLVEIYSGDPASGGVKLNQATAGFEWVFDYQSGVLYFPNSIPAGLTSPYIKGYRYIGGKGLGGAGANIKDDQIVYSGSSVTSGTYTFTNFFAYIPQSDTTTAYFNGVRMDDSEYTVSGTSLILNIDIMPYDLDDGDVISCRYAWAG